VITHITLKNYRSFVDASFELQPFTLVIGANGSGKSNLLKFFADISRWTQSGFRLSHGAHPDYSNKLLPHLNDLGSPTTFLLARSTLPTVRFDGTSFIHTQVPSVESQAIFAGLFNEQPLEIYSIQSERVSEREAVGDSAPVSADGSGVIRILDLLKTGAEEERFDRIEEELKNFIPEVEKLALAPAGTGHKLLQMSLEGIKDPVPGKLLSHGTRVLTALLTIIFQPTPPPLLLVEDLDHGIHPKLFADLVSLLREVCDKTGMQIIATTHNPYLIDCFEETPDAVLLVEKERGNSTVKCLGPEVRKLSDSGRRLPSLSKLYFSNLLTA
jgi:predicted ATPase